MSTAEIPPRPRQLVLAAGVVIGGSAFLVAAVFDSLSRLQSVDTRTQLREAVSSAAGKNMGITLDQAIEAMRAALSLTAVCAAIALVLGVFVLQRHRGARIALSVVAVPLLVTAPLVGGFLGAFVAVATLMLWNGPAGDWYAGRPIRQPSGPGLGAGASRREQRPPVPTDLPPHPAPPPHAVPPSEPSDASAAPSTRETSTTPEATQGFGVPAVASAEAPAPTATYGAPPPAAPTVPASVPMPVRVACLLTWTFSGSVALMYLAGMVALVVDRSAIVDRVVDSQAWRDTGASNDLLVPLLWFGVALFLVWSLGAVVLAYFTWRRHDWARYLLAVSAALALLVGAIAFPVGILHQIACAATIGTLFSPRSRAWFAARGRHPRPPQSPSEGQLPPPPPPPGGPW